MPDKSSINQPDKPVEAAASELEIIQATAGADVMVAIATLAEAARWTDQQGFPTWKAGSFEQVLAAAAEQKELYLAIINRQVAATFILQWQDDFFWEGDPHPAGYIHKLAVRREFAGRNV